MMSIKEYIKDKCCPYCKSRNYDAYDHPAVEDEEVYTALKCYNCGRAWREIYYLADIEGVTNEEKFMCFMCRR